MSETQETERQGFSNPFDESSHSAETARDTSGPFIDVLSPTDQRGASTVTTPSSNGKLRTESIHDKGENPLHENLEKMETVETASDEAIGVMEKIKTAAHSAAHKYHLDSMHATGVTRFLNPTNIHMRVRFGGERVDDQAEDHVQKLTELALTWRSRDNRKGRNSIAVPSLHATGEPTFLPTRYTPRLKSSLKGVGSILWKMLTTFPYWDMAFWSGWSYTIGSALFVADGALAFGPVAFGDGFESESAEKYGGPLCFFIGALFYQVGAVMAYLEAVNDGSFHGSAMRRLLDGHEEDEKKMLDEKLQGFFSGMVPHRHRNEEVGQEAVDPEAGWNTKEARHLRPGSIYPEGKAPASRRGAIDMGGDEGQTSTYYTWRWYPSWRALRTHHVYEIGWLACTIQLFGVTLYGVTAIVVLPGILTSLAWWQKLGAFWAPQAVAASCFLVASLMFMLETQEKWWKPEPAVIGWWVGFWATTGSIGFLLIACFGFASHTHTWAEYQSDLATIWGSAAYLISSWLQWYEALDKNEVEELFNEPGEMKSHQVHPI